MKKTHIFLFLTLFLLAFHAPSHASAQAHSASSGPELSLSLSPPILEVLMKRGTTLQQTYTLTNNGENTIVVATLGAIDSNGTIQNEETFVPEAWITIVNSTIGQKPIQFKTPFLLPSKTEVRITLAIAPGREEKEGNFGRVLLFTTIAGQSGIADSTFSSVQERIGAVILLTISEEEQVQKAAQIVYFDVPSMFDSFGPLKVSAQIKNTGKTFFRPNGTFSLKGPIGQASFSIAPQVYFPNDTKQLAFLTNDTTGDRTGFLTIRGLFVGVYEGILSFTLDEGTITIEEKKRIIAIPWKAGLGIFLAIVCVWILIRARKARYNQVNETL